MRRFLVQVVLLTIAMTITIVLLSLATVGGVPLLVITSSPDAALELDVFLGDTRLDLVVGFVFAVMATILPVFLAVVFGRWYLRHPLAALVIVNAVLFAAVARVSGWLGSPFTVPEPT